MRKLKRSSLSKPQEAPPTVAPPAPPHPLRKRKHEREAAPRKSGGRLAVGVSGKGTVVMHLRDLPPFYCIVFSPRQARYLAKILNERATIADTIAQRANAEASPAKTKKRSGNT